MSNAMPDFEASGYYAYGVFTKRLPTYPIASFIIKSDAELFTDALNDSDPSNSNNYEWRAL